MTTPSERESYGPCAIRPGCTLGRHRCAKCGKPQPFHWMRDHAFVSPSEPEVGPLEKGVHYSLVEDDGSPLCWEGDLCPEITPTISTYIGEVTCDACRQHYRTLDDLKRAEAVAPEPYKKKWPSAEAIHSRFCGENGQLCQACQLIREDANEQARRTAR